ALPLLDYNLEVTQWLWRNLGGPISGKSTFKSWGSFLKWCTTSISTQDIVRELAKWLPKEKSSQCLDSSQNKSCIVVGNSANLLGKNLGVVIDSHDVVFRLNTAKTRNFESDVGSKTCMRIIYPESASLVANNQSRESEILFQAYKDEDLLWLLLASDQRVNSVIRDSLFHGLKFWAKFAGLEIGDAKNCPGWWLDQPALDNRRVGYRELINQQVTRHANGFPVPNPSTYSSKVRRTFVLNPLMMRNVRLVAGLKGNPTSGLVAIVLALKSCNSVTIAGFGYSRDRSVSAHYYEVKESSTILNRKNPGRHSVRDEANFIARLAARHFIKNLTPFP
ncbi:unnamed protein product, partial [Notodromas monacha]